MTQLRSKNLAEGRKGKEGFIRAIVTDVEGTTTAASFIYETLFPYAKQNLAPFMQKNANKQAVVQALEDIKTRTKVSKIRLEDTITLLLTWMEQNQKITPLKTLQGLVWEEGYQQGTFKGHVFEDAYRHLQNWKSKGIDLFSYSSGSSRAQKLLFTHSTFGNLAPLFSGHFDTQTGCKRETRSYHKIIQHIDYPAEHILFLSDSLEELNAAKMAGMQTTLICRSACFPPVCPHPMVKNFDELKSR